jgi:hypothetical protein
MLALPFMVLMAASQADPATPQECPAKLLQIDRVEVGAPVDRLLEAYGNPTTRNTLEGEHYEEELVFDGVRAYTISDRIEYLASSRQGSCVDRNLCVGSAADEVERRFAGFVRSQDGKSLHCPNTASACSLVAEGAPTIEKLVLQCLP